MRILIIKLSSLGDVVHAMPAVQDIRTALPHAQMDWVVERAFAPLATRCTGVARVIPCDLRRWRKAPFAADTRAAWRAFKADLQSTAYDAVIDLQGLTKSALIARLARLAPGGQRIAMGNRTEGSGYEAATRWVADVAVELPWHIHAIDRARLTCARSLGYAAEGIWRFGLHAPVGVEKFAIKNGVNAQQPGPPRPTVALVHGTSRDDKLWPESSWGALGERLLAQGLNLALPHGNDAELARAQRLAAAWAAGRASVWPRLPLDALTDALAGCAGVIGVDSGLSHIATALDLPHVQLYNFDTAWRTGPQPGAARQRAVVGQGAGPVSAPAALPTLDAVWAAWLAVMPPEELQPLPNATPQVTPQMTPPGAAA